MAKRLNCDNWGQRVGEFREWFISDCPNSDGGHCLDGEALTPETFAEWRRLEAKALAWAHRGAEAVPGVVWTAQLPHTTYSVVQRRDGDD